MHSSRERNVEDVEQDQRYETLLQKSDAHLPDLLSLSELANQVHTHSHKQFGQHHEQHDVAVVDETAREVHPAEVVGQLLGLASQCDVEPVEGLELGERSEVDVEEAVLGEREVGQLEHSEELQSHYLAAEQRNQQDAIADDLCRLEQHLGVFRGLALLLIVEQGWRSGIVGDVEQLSRPEVEDEGLIGDVPIVLRSDVDVRGVLLLLDDVDALVDEVEVVHDLVQGEDGTHHRHRELVAARLLD